MVVLSTISSAIFQTGDDNVVNYKDRLEYILGTSGNEFASHIDTKIHAAKSGFLGRIACLFFPKIIVVSRPFIPFKGSCSIRCIAIFC